MIFVVKFEFLTSQTEFNTRRIKVKYELKIFTVINTLQNRQKNPVYTLSYIGISSGFESSYKSAQEDSLNVSEPLQWEVGY